jgi:hypothetical protein
MSRLPVRPERDPLSPWTKAILALIQGLLPAMTAIIGGLWVAYTYLAHQREAQKEEIERAARENVTQLVQAQSPFLRKQLDLYFETAQVAGRLVVLTPDDKEWAGTEQRFWALYWSELSMVEDRRVDEAMVTFSKGLNDYTAARKTTKERNQPFDEVSGKQPLNAASLELAHAIRKSIESAWRSGIPSTAEETR